jgi:mycothiol synthase
VHPDFQGRGIGLRLLEALEGQACEPDEIAQCNSQHSWTACNSFLEHFGFAVEERERLMRIVRPPATDATALPLRQGMAIRIAVPGDDLDWAALHLQAFHARDDFSELTPGDQAQARATPGFSLVVAEDNTGLAGYCQLAHLDAEEGLINSLVVRTDMQGQGLGRLLLAHGLQRLWSQSLATVSLNVLSTNAAAIRVYEKTGFRGYDELLRYQRKTRVP